MQELPFQTITQIAALVLTLVAGWLFGLASAPGGGKWRERYMDEELENAGYRDRAEQDLRDASRKIRDLEAENAKLRATAEPAASEGHSTATVAGAAVVGAALAAAAANAAHEADATPVVDENPAVDDKPAEVHPPVVDAAAPAVAHHS